MRRRPGRGALAIERNVVCVHRPTTLVVDIVRLHSSSIAKQGHLESGTVVYAVHVHGPYTVQVVVQKRSGSLPDIATARALAQDPRLLAGI